METEPSSPDAEQGEVHLWHLSRNVPEELDVNYGQQVAFKCLSGTFISNNSTENNSIKPRRTA